MAGGGSLDSMVGPFQSVKLRRQPRRQLCASGHGPINWRVTPHRGPNIVTPAKPCIAERPISVVCVWNRVKLKINYPIPVAVVVGDDIAAVEIRVWIRSCNRRWMHRRGTVCCRPISGAAGQKQTRTNGRKNVANETDRIHVNNAMLFVLPNDKGE